MERPDVADDPSPCTQVLLYPVVLELNLKNFVPPEAVATKTNLKSVKVAGMLEKVIVLVELPRVVVAIGSYVVGIYAPLIPYSEKVDPLVKFSAISVMSTRFTAAVLFQRPECKPISPLPFLSKPEKARIVFVFVVLA